MLSIRFKILSLFCPHATSHSCAYCFVRQMSVIAKILSLYGNFFLMFCWPCISIHMCNKNQLDALFIPSLFHQSTSTCFGHIFSPSSGGILYIYNNWYGLCFSVDCLLLCIYSIPPDDGLHIRPKHVEVDWRNKLMINSASSWFLLHRLCSSPAVQCFSRYCSLSLF